MADKEDEEDCVDEAVRDTFMFARIDVTDAADRKKAGSAFEWLLKRQEAAANRTVRRGAIVGALVSGSLLALIVGIAQHYFLPLLGK